jgi:transposase
MRKAYPSDIIREQIEIIRYTLESAKKATRPRAIDIYEIFCAVLYRIREGCRWRSLPHDFPKWEICCYHYNEWRKSFNNEEGVLDRALRELVEGERCINGCTPNTTMLIGYAAPDLQGWQKVLVDGGYSGENFSNSIKELIGAQVEVVKRNERHRFAVLPKRWGVKRTFGWLEDCLLLWKNCERKIHNTLQAAIFALVLSC